MSIVSSMIKAIKKITLIFIFHFLIYLSPSEVFAYKKNQDLIEIYINGNLVDRLNNESISINNLDFGICLSSGKLTHYGLKKNYIKKISATLECIASSYHHQIEYVFIDNTLSLIIPEYFFRSPPKENIPTFLWDDGIPGALINYNTNIAYFYDHENNQSYKDYFLQIKPQFNLDAWRLHNSFTLQKNEKWKKDYIYAEKGINSLKSRVFLGELESNSEFFEHYSYMGIHFNYDELMVSYDSLAYTPVIKGIAKTTAKVIITQNNRTLTELTVLSGPFEITNIPIIDPFGELKVTVIESDGTEHSFYEPYYIPSLALQEGANIYSLSGGFYRGSDEIKETIPVGLVSFKSGLPSGITAYGGAQISDSYQSMMFGSIFSTGVFGEISTDISTAISNTKFFHKKTGSKFSFKYKKNINENNSISIYSEKKTSKSYKTLNETISSNRENYTIDDYLLNKASQYYSKSGITINQNLNKYGNFNVSSAAIKYNNENLNKTIDINYDLTLWGKIYASLNISKNIFKHKEKQSQTIYNILFSIPFHNENNSINTSYQYTSFPENVTAHEIGIYSNLLDNNLSLDIRERYDNTSGLDNSIMLNYQNKKSEFSGYYNYSKNHRQLGYSMQGGLFISQYGLNFSQAKGDTFGLLNTTNINKDDFYYSNNIELDENKHFFIDNLQPYQQNTLIFSSTEDGNTNSSLALTPTKGAFIYIEPNKYLNKKQRISIKISKNTIAPLGTIVSIIGNQSNSAIVNEYGEAYLSISKKNERLKIQWGKDKNQQCIGVLHFETDNRKIQNIGAICI